MPDTRRHAPENDNETVVRQQMRILLYLGAAIVLLVMAALFLDGCEKDGSIGHVSAQVDTSAARQVRMMKAARFHDSIASVAVIMQLSEVSATLAKQKDSTAWLQKINAQHLNDRQRLDKVFMAGLNGQKQAFSNMMDEKLDSMVARIDTLTAIQSGMAKLLGDSALTGRMAKASFDQLYKTASLKNEWFDSETLFGKSDSGKEQASVVPLFKNKTGVEVYKYVAPKKGVAGVVGVNVTEANPYAAIGAQNFELSIPALKGKPKKIKPIRAAKPNTRKRQRKNFNKTGGPT